MSATDLHGEEAERTVPPATQGTLYVLRQRGHIVTVRRSARNGSWYYSVDGNKELRGGPLAERYRKLGYPL